MIYCLSIYYSFLFIYLCIYSGRSDPYAILTVGATTYKTPTIKNSLDPVWNETYDFPIGNFGLIVHLKSNKNE